MTSYSHQFPEIVKQFRKRPERIQNQILDYQYSKALKAISAFYKGDEAEKRERRRFIVKFYTILEKSERLAFCLYTIHYYEQEGGDHD